MPATRTDTHLRGAGFCSRLLIWMTLYAISIGQQRKSTQLSARTGKSFVAGLKSAIYEVLQICLPHSTSFIQRSRQL